MNYHLEQGAYSFALRGTSDRYVRVQAGLKIMAFGVITLETVLFHYFYVLPVTNDSSSFWNFLNQSYVIFHSILSKEEEPRVVMLYLNSSCPSYFIFRL